MGGGLEAVHARHPDVEEDDGEALPQEGLHGLLTGAGTYQRLVEGCQDGLQGDQVVLHVVDEEYARASVGPVPSGHGEGASPSSVRGPGTGSAGSRVPSGSRTAQTTVSSWSTSTGLGT